MVHRPPSYVRYQKEHPPITVHLTREIRSLLDDIKEKSGMSYGRIIKGIIENDLTHVKRTRALSKSSYEKGYIDGYDLAESEWRIWYYCSVCGKPMYVKPEDKSHNAIIKYMKEHQWGHSKCLRRNRIEE